MAQHYPITFEQIAKHYQKGDLTAKGALKFWVRTKLAEGWKCSINPQEIRKALSKGNNPMPKSTFWHALHQLAEEGEIEFDEPENITIRRLSKKPDTVPDSEPPSKILDSHPKNKTAVPNSEPPSKILDEQPVEAIPNKVSSNAPDYSQYSYQTFFNSLSNSEREKFENFCRKETAGLPKPIISLRDYLAAHDASGQPRYLDFYQRFKNTAEGKEQHTQKVKESLTEELYQQWEKEFQEVNYNYRTFAQLAQRNTPEWDLRVKFCQLWDERNK